MVLALATLLVCGFMVAIYRILRAEERCLAARQSEQPVAGQRSQSPAAAQSNETPEVVSSLAKAESHSPQD